MSSLLALSDESECSAFEPSGGGGGDDIDFSVGVGGRNLSDDVTTVQSLLNNLPPGNGGPNPSLVVDGKAGPRTNAAIRQFQYRQLGWADGRVDPDGPTFQKLHELNPDSGVNPQVGPSAPGATPAPDSPQARAIRLATALSVQPDVRRAIVRARLALDGALLLLNGQTPLTGFSPAQQKTLRLFQQHFGDAGKQLQTSMRFVLQHYINMLASADNARPSIFGGTFGNFLDVDPLHLVVNAKGEPLFAYVRQQGSKSALLDGAKVDPTKIYLTAAMDGHSRDEFLRIGLHELAHLSSNVAPAAILADNASGFVPAYFTIEHSKRIRNADSYANFAFELTFGNTRLAAIMPLLRVIEIDPVVIGS
jgi:peptidoglycan hydrolase-like protein with peptidoglycan-binding domain